MTDRARSRRDPRSPAEWVTFTVAALIVGGIAGAVAWLWIRGFDRPADAVVRRSGPVRQVGSRFYVRVEVDNRGDRTAQAVQVVAELTQRGEVVEEAEQTVDFLSGGEVETVEFVFTEDPASGELAVRVAGFLLP
ncbi:MAG TPA: TIGR02588 family protein [Mycobacteriales bacterium]|jgi:uncharacterized protein (TIGR02588 family)|nr:TIGR02588 family protein [Mycobacteriales bacterium]